MKVKYPIFIFSCLFLCLVISNPLAAQRGTPSNAIMTNLLGLGGLIAGMPISSASLSYEHAFKVKKGYRFRKMSALLDLEYGLFSSKTSQEPNHVNGEVQYTGMGAKLQYRYYFNTVNEMAPMGLFGGVYGRYMSLDGSLENPDEAGDAAEPYLDGVKGSATRAGVVMGYKIGNKKFVIEPVADYYFEFSNGFTDDSVNPFFKKDKMALLVRAAIKIGFRF